MTEKDIRNRETLNKYLELVKSDSERIFSDKSEFISTRCIACNSIDYSFEFEKNNFIYVKCKNCDTLFVNPRPGFQGLTEFYSNSPSTKYWIEEFFSPVSEIRREKIFNPRANYICTNFPELSQRKIGDIGAGFGIFIEEMTKLWPKAELTAIEPSVDMANLCRKKGISVIEKMLEDIDYNKTQFDLLTSFELIEHLFEPKEFLKRVYTLLNSGGYLFMTTLSGLGFDIQLLWEKSKSVFPPHHLNFFNPFSIGILLKEVGFNIIEISTPGELDLNIIENGYKYEGNDPGRFIKTIFKYGSNDSKSELQEWIKKFNFSSHMRIIAQKT